VFIKREIRQKEKEKEKEGIIPADGKTKQQN
jgi:hypothetical protein